MDLVLTLWATRELLNSWCLNSRLNSIHGLFSKQEPRKSYITVFFRTLQSLLIPFKVQAKTPQSPVRLPAPPVACPQQISPTVLWPHWIHYCFQTTHRACFHSGHLHLLFTLPGNSLPEHCCGFPSLVFWVCTQISSLRHLLRWLGMMQEHLSPPLSTLLSVSAWVFLTARTISFTVYFCLY